MNKLYKKITGFLRSNTFFYGVVGLFVFSSLWIALSGRYPMAFDENYHYGIIKQYAAQWSPFFKHPPAYSEALGDITRYPSYLFHYLMSFPYRFISLLTQSETVKIVILRIMNIALLSSSLFIFKALLKRLGVGLAVVNVSLFVFVLTPVVTFLGAQINYDNLLIPLTAGVILLFITIVERYKTGELSVARIVALLGLCLLTSLVKFTFLPVFFCLGVAGIFMVWRGRESLPVMLALTDNLKKIGVFTKVLMVVGLIISGGLFVERYGVNLVKYKTPVPDCEQVLSVSSCLQYGPWARDYYLVKAKTGAPSWNALRYSGHWTAQSMHELFFAIDQTYAEKGPLPLLYYTSWVLGVGGVVLVLLFNKRVRSLPHAGLVLFIISVYGLILWADNYHRFNSVNWPVAIHGRYLLPLLPIGYAILAYAYTLLAQKYAKRFASIYPVVLVALFLVVLQGGVVTYLVRSSTSWYWENSVISSVNTSVGSALRRILFISQ